MKARVAFGVVVLVLTAMCGVALKASVQFPMPCKCRISCYLVCAKADPISQKFLLSDGRH